MADSPLTVLSLCSGIAMLDEGFALGVEHVTGRLPRVVGYCERESYAASILVARMADAAMESAPVYVGNFEDADWRAFHGVVDCVVAGFPCQPWSAAGKQAGTEDERWLWPAIAECLSAVEPSLCFIENVPGLLSGGGFELVLSDLAALGFDAEWCHLSAAAVGASHERDRIFLLAFKPGGGQRILRKSSGFGGFVEWGGEDVDDPDRNGEKRAWREKSGATTGCSELANSECPQWGPIDNSCDPEGKNALSQRKKGTGRIGIADQDVAHSARERLGKERNDCERSSQRVECASTMEDSGFERMRRGAGRNEATGRRACAEIAGSSNVMAHAGEPRREGREQRSACIGDGHGPQAHGSTGEFRGAFAPGPGDPRWAEIIEREPWLAPATEPGVCGMVAGQSVVVDASRADQLRCLGNQVVALQSAAALVALARRAGLT